MKKKQAMVWIVCFALMLFLPRAVWMASDGRFEMAATENTVTIEPPEFSAAAWLNRSYMTELEHWYHGGQPFRSQMILMNSLMERNLFREKNINDSVILGDEGWLFYSAESNIQDYKGTNRMTAEQLAAVADNLTASREYLEQKGMEFVLFIAPNKETIYGEEYLPAYYRKGTQTRVDQLVEYLREHTDIRVVYPVEALTVRRGDCPLYGHYDTHWNAAGGYIGARELLAELGIEIPSPEELTYTEEPYGTGYAGYDLARMMNLQQYYEKYQPADVNYSVSGFDSHNGTQVPEDDLPGQHFKSDAPDGRTLFVAGDSFGGGLIGAAASNFRESYLVPWGGGFKQAMLEEKNADVFVLEIVERNMDYLNTFRLTE